MVMSKRKQAPFGQQALCSGDIEVNSHEHLGRMYLQGSGYQATQET